MSRRGAVLGALFVVVGVAWLIDVLDVVEVLRWSVVLPAILIAIGAWMVAEGLRSRRHEPVAGAVDVTAILGDRHVRVDGRFDGGAAVAVLGDVEVDLRHAELGASTVTLDVTTVLGEVDVLVPDGWRVRTTGPVLLADVDVRRDAPSDRDAPELVVHTTGLLGDVTVR